MENFRLRVRVVRIVGDRQAEENTHNECQAEAEPAEDHEHHGSTVPAFSATGSRLSRFSSPRREEERALPPAHALARTATRFSKRGE